MIFNDLKHFLNTHLGKFSLKKIRQWNFISKTNCVLILGPNQRAKFVSKCVKSRTEDVPPNLLIVKYFFLMSFVLNVKMKVVKDSSNQHVMTFP